MTTGERLALYVALTALTAFAIDGVLPAMPLMEAALPPATPLSGAQIVTAFVLGMSVGELVAGPVSDAVGRRPAVIGGLAILALGTVVAATADSFAAVVAGRLLQGIGVAGPKIGTRAMIRDRYEGAEMAKVLSVIFTLLILVPMVAPGVGAGIVAATGWRGVFWAYLALGGGLGAWLWLRHPETLPAGRRVPLRPGRLAANAGAVIRRRDVTPVVVATGFVFGAQLTYLAVAAELFGDVYALPSLMPALFALLATGTAAALLLNVRLVGRVGMEVPISAGLVLLAASGAGLLVAAAPGGGRPAIGVFIGLGWVGFFALGLLFGNLNALAMRPLGALAGLGSSIVASGSSVVAFAFATLVEAAAGGPVAAVAWAFSLSAALAALSILPAVARRRRR